jgi:pimeloyl-ACP methyl ester carboxylesterase
MSSIVREPPAIIGGSHSAASADMPCSYASRTRRLRLCGSPSRTLLLSGSEDTWSPISQHETMRRRIPHATLFEIHGAGHMAPIERPDAVALALRKWLAEI